MAVLKLTGYASLWYENLKNKKGKKAKAKLLGSFKNSIEKMVLA